MSSKNARFCHSPVNFRAHSAPIRAHSAPICAHSHTLPLTCCHTNIDGQMTKTENSHLNDISIYLLRTLMTRGVFRHENLAQISNLKLLSTDLTLNKGSTKCQHTSNCPRQRYMMQLHASQNHGFCLCVGVREGFIYALTFLIICTIASLRVLDSIFENNASCHGDA